MVHFANTNILHNSSNFSPTKVSLHTIFPWCILRILKVIMAYARYVSLASLSLSNSCLTLMHILSGLLKCPLYPQTNTWTPSKVSEDPKVETLARWRRSNGTKTSLGSVVSWDFPWYKSSGNKGRSFFKYSWQPATWVWCLTSWICSYVTEVWLNVVNPLPITKFANFPWHQSFPPYGKCN